MPLSLEYRNTFIDVLEDLEETSEKRARSAPPGHVRRISFTAETREEEEAMQSYVGSLSQNATDICRSHSSQDEVLQAGSTPYPDADTRGEHAPPTLPTLPSLGCWGHPEVCRRPCIYFISGHCENGQSCAYCHLPHQEKTPKLDKRQRQMVQQLGWAQMVFMVLPLCRKRAEEAGFANQAKEVLALVEAAPAPTVPVQPEYPESLSGHELRNLRKALSRMNFGHLIGLLARLSPDQAEGLDKTARLNAALDVLRRQLPFPDGMQV